MIRMTAHHELLQVTVAQNRDVMCEINARSTCIFRGKQNFRSRFLRDVIADHRVQTVEVGNLAEVDLLYCSHALKKCGLFEIVENDQMNVHEKARAIKADYDSDDCRKGYDTCMRELETLGFTEAQADDILIPVTRINGTYPK